MTQKNVLEFLLTKKVKYINKVVIKQNKYHFISLQGSIIREKNIDLILKHGLGPVQRALKTNVNIVEIIIIVDLAVYM